MSSPHPATRLLSARPATPDVILARKNEQRNVYFPDMTRLFDGRLAVVYYSSRQHMPTADSTICLIMGSPDGTEWSEPRIIIDNPGRDDRDPSICQLASGRILVTWFRRDPANLEDPQAGCHTMYSDDLGQTWSPAVAVPTSLSLAACTAPPVELSDGQLLFPGYGYQPSDPQRCGVRTIASFDSGASWEGASEVAVPNPAEANVGLVEPVLLALGKNELGKEELLMVIRSEAHPKERAYVSRSVDGANSWSDPKVLDFAGHAPDLLRLESESGSQRCLLTWGESNPANPGTRPVLGRIVDARDPELSGETFEIYTNPRTRDMSYPCAARIDPETALVIFYDSDRGYIGGSFVSLL